MDSHNDTQSIISPYSPVFSYRAQEIDSKPSSTSINALLQGQGPSTEEERRLIHGILYSAATPANDNESETNTSSLQHNIKGSVTGPASSFTKNSASSKQIIMNRSATSENVAREGPESAPASNLGNKGIFDTPAAAINGQQPPSGIDNGGGVYANYNPVGGEMTADQLHIQQYNSQHCFDNSQMTGAGPDRYHNRHATHLYGAGGTATSKNTGANLAATAQHSHVGALGSSNFREQSSSSATNLMPKSNTNGTGSILINAGQYASQAVTATQHHIPIRNNATTTGQLLMQLTPSTMTGGSMMANRGSSQQSNHHPSQSATIAGAAGGAQQPQNTMSSLAQSTLSQQQIQQQQYKTAKTQMYEKMLIQQQSIITDKKPHIFAQPNAAVAGGNLNQTQMAAATALNQQHQFLSNQAFQQQQSLIFPRIANIRNENAGPIYKTASQQPISQQMIAATSNAQIGTYIQQQQSQAANIQSPFTQTHKQNQQLLASPGQPTTLAIMANNNFAGSKKKTVSPRNLTSNNQGYAVTNQGSSLGAPKMLLMADKNQQMLDFAQGKSIAPQTIGLLPDEYKNSQVETSEKNRNRLKSNHHYNMTTSEFQDTATTAHLKLGTANNHYNTEKLNGHQILINSDSQSALGGIKNEDPRVHALTGNAANQFFCGEMSLNGDNARRLASEDPSILYHQQAITPSIMSSHSNKRQSHHINMYNPAQQAMIQQQISNAQAASIVDNSQQQSSMNHNFFSRRTVSQKESNGQVGFKIPLTGSSTNPANNQHQQQTEFIQQQQLSSTTYPFSPQGGLVNMQNSQLKEDPQRTKYMHSSNMGARASQDGSPSKSAMMNSQQIATTTPSTTGTVATTDALSSQQPSESQSQTNNTVVTTGQTTAEGQQTVKIPVICGFHKRVLLLTSQIQNQPGQITVNGLPMAGPQNQQQRESINKKVRNRNPNCNHNNNSVFYAPCYNNVKYDDSYKKKEEVLRKVFFKECAREDDKRISQQQYYPPSGVNGPQNKNDPFTYLKPIENFLIQTLFIDYDIQQANKQNPGNVPLRVPAPNSNLFMELGLEQAIVAHKAFLLALIQSGKITNENMLKVLHEFKSSQQEFDHECIYCKYSQYALRESTKVIKNSLKAVAADPSNPEYEAANRQLALIGQPQMTQQQQLMDQMMQDPRIEYLIRMFQSQLFKRSFINTSLMIIQRKMNEKLLQKQRLPPGLNGQQGQPQGQLLDANGKPKKPIKPDPNKKNSNPPMSSLEWIGAQIQKLAKNLANPKDKDKYLELKEKYYREFLMQINRSNNAIIPFPKATFTPYKYYIGKGNNSILIRNCLKQRFWWSMGDFEEWDEYNFIWTQWKANKIVAKIKTNQEVLAITADVTKNGKDGVATSDSMLSTDRDSNSSAETLLSTPTKRKRVATALLTSSQNISAANSLAIKKNTSASKTNVLQKPNATGTGPAQLEDSKEKKETSHNVITYNHMENNYHLSNKKALYYNMKIYYESIGQDWFSVLPLTFHIKEGPNDKEYLRFTELFKDYDSGKSQGAFEKLGKQIWIVKPGENTNRGCGIQVCRELPQIKEIISNTNFNGQKRSYIIQKYIEKPLLYKNRKFDIRTYTLMTTVNGNLQGYWYNEGYLRTSSKDFNLKNVTNRLIHLTNDAVQKKSDDYGKFESGNKLSYPDFQKYLDSVDIKCNFVKEIVPQLKKMAADTIKACSRKVDPHRRHNTFEIFGYDFMIDEDMKPWLIEVNTNPCLELSAPYLSRLIPTMVENAIKIAVDPLFPPPPWPNAKKHTIPDCIDNNRFELVFNELTDAAELKNLPIDDGAMNGIIEEEEMEDEGSDNDGDEEEIA